MRKKRENISDEFRFCVMCGTRFSRRSAKGVLMTFSKWAKKITCCNRCHMLLSWSNKRETERSRFWRQVNKVGPKECWLWLGGARCAKGYGGFSAGNGKMERAHRTSWRMANGPIPEGMVVRHSCDNPPCCNPKHLQIGTVADNNNDRDTRGRHVALERDKNPRTKYKTEIAREIVRDFWNLERHPKGTVKNGELKKVTDKFNIPKAVIYNLAKNAGIWKETTSTK